MDRIPGKNITAKILALILATVLWLYVMNEQNPPIEAGFTAMLETRNADGGYIVTNAPDAIQVKVRGPRSIIAGLQARDIRAYLDIRGLGEGKHTVKVHASVPASLELVEVNPDTVSVTIEKAINKQLPVEVSLSGTPADSLVVGKAVANPQQVTVEGPKSLVNEAQRVVAPVDLTGKNGDFDVSVPLRILGRDGKEIKGLTLYPGQVSVSLNLMKGVNKKILDIKTIVFGNLTPGVTLKRIITEPDKIEVSGPNDVLDKLDSVYTEPINVTGITKDTAREVKLQIKEGLVASQNSVIVHISVEPKPAVPPPH
ncbi:Hypothetical protein LUCI_0093 [Lucifera butyrica]|uniref:YbbR-like n=1 Tax=Lucifera butyrica TaxID=1351585 RepID=A0A498R242_9FIRM|nr:CdaR family protein [Lucifera butyrica]VBB04887.1 Hypothetical protein LUCI_0093 [Lucifera butyrica]